MEGIYNSETEDFIEKACDCAEKTIKEKEE